MRYYPIFLDLRERPVVVIGGGEVALRKVTGLLAAEAKVTVVSPHLHPNLVALLNQGRFTHISRHYQPGDLEGYALAFVATDDRSVNASVAAEGKERGLWVNAVDDPPHCDFIAPSVIQRGNLVIAISSGGGSPAATRKIREELEEFLSEDYALLLDIASEVRTELGEKGISVDAETWNQALSGEFRRLLREGKRDEAKRALRHSLLEPVRSR